MPGGQKVDAHGKRGKRDADDHFALALEIDSKDLLRAPVGEPETVRVPAWRLAEGDAGQKGLEFKHGEGYFHVPDQCTCVLLVLSTVCTWQQDTQSRSEKLLVSCSHLPNPENKTHQPALEPPL